MEKDGGKRAKEMVQLGGGQERRRKTGLVGERPLKPYAPYGVKRNNNNSNKN